MIIIKECYTYFAFKNFLAIYNIYKMFEQKLLDIDEEME